MAIISLLTSITSLVLFIIVLVKLFKREGVGMGILGILCGLYTLIWGWMKHKEENLTMVMIIWTILIIINVILNVMSVQSY